MTDDDEIRLAIVSTRSEEDIERERHLWRIEAYSRRLAGNMIRVIRGAGNPHHLFENVMHLAEEINASPKGTLIGDINRTIEGALSDGISEEDERFDGGVVEIERGALRKVAARILQQPLQVTAGNRDLWEGFYTVERYRARKRREWMEAERGVVRATPKARKLRAKAAKAITPSALQSASKPVKAVIAKPMLTPARPIVVMDEPEPEPKTTADYLRINAKRIREGKPTI